MKLPSKESLFSLSSQDLQNISTKDSLKYTSSDLWSLIYITLCLDKNSNEILFDIDDKREFHTNRYFKYRDSLSSEISFSNQSIITKSFIITM